MREKIAAFLKSVPPVRITFMGYLSYVLIGWLSLCLPWSQQVAGEATSALDHLFIATSAVSTTGLATISPSGTYSFLGELFILLMIQVGGIGYMTLGSFIVLTRTHHLPELQEQVSRTTFDVPEGIPLETFLRQVVIFTVVVESVGALALWAAFSSAGVEGALWQAIFHSVSAFCTAGFSLFGDGLEGFRADFWVNAVVCALSYAGAIGFIVWTDFVLKVFGRRERMTLTSKIILSATFWLTAAGTATFMVMEPSIEAMPAHERLMVSVFQTMSAITTVGFNTHAIGALCPALIVMMSLLMLIGASPSGTGGGLKSTTFTIFVGLVRSAFSGGTEVTFRGKRIPDQRVLAATSAVATYLAVVFLALFALAALEQELEFGDLLFEVFSAAGTVGLSRGITGALEPLSKLVLVAVMFAGRLGPLVLGVALFMTPEGEAIEHVEEEEDVAT